MLQVWWRGPLEERIWCQSPWAGGCRYGMTSCGRWKPLNIWTESSFDQYIVDGNRLRNSVSLCGYGMYHLIDIVWKRLMEQYVCLLAKSHNSKSKHVYATTLNIVLSIKSMQFRTDREEPYLENGSDTVLHVRCWLESRKLISLSPCPLQTNMIHENSPENHLTHT